MLPAAVFELSCRGTRSTCDFSGLRDPAAEFFVTRNYSINQRMLFDENYGLAATQSLKNKDIPEGGAKGTILPSCVNSLPIFAFYIPSIQSWSAA
jgi:hypothetical protein